MLAFGGYIEQTLESFATQQVLDYRSSEQPELPPLQAGLSNFASEEEMQAAFKAFAAEYWDGLLGEEIVREKPPEQVCILVPGAKPTCSPLLVFPQVATDTSEHVRVWSVSPSTQTLSASWTEPLQDGNENPERLRHTEGGFLYVAKNRGIDIFDVSDTSNPQLVSSIVTPLAITPEFFLHNDRLVTLSGGSIRVFDVSDRSQPSEMAAWTIRGAIQEARIDDGQLLVFMENRIQLPAPEVVWYEGVNPGQKLARDTEGVFGRFETESEYLARVSPELAELFFTRIADGTDDGIWDAPNNIEYEIAGDWQDFAFHTDAITSHQTFVAMFDVESDAPSLVDTEIVNGLSVDWVHIGEENVHIAGTDPGPRVWHLDNPALLDQTWLASLDVDDGEVRAVALGGVEGTVTGGTGLDEHDGLLRVVTANSDLYVLDEVGSRYEILGELLDFADGQEAFGAYFDGERALVTTSVVENLRVLPFDPLHVIDLSDPTAPLELSELDIPGVVGSLHWVGEDHFVGVGFAVTGSWRWSTQVTLYDVSDLANPLVVENWVNKASSTRWLTRENMLQPESITFDSSTGTLLVSPHRNHNNAKNGALAFHIDLQATESKVQFLGRVATGQLTERALVIDEAIAVLSADSVSFYDIKDIDKQLSRFFTVKPEALGERITISSLGESNLDVLANERINGPIRITDVSASRKGAEVDIAEDGLSLIYMPASSDYSERLTYTIEDQLGNLYQAQVNVHVPKSQFNDVVIDYDIRITDENGDPVSDARIGDRLWIELSAGEVAEQKFGIFQAIYNVQFDTDALRVIGEPEALNGYSNAFQQVFTDEGFTRLGGFTGSFEPQLGRFATVRFQVEVTQAGTYQINALPGRAFPEDDILIYRGDAPQVSPDNVLPASATISAVPAEDSSPVVLEPTDVDGDGFTTHIDVLRIVQHLNRRDTSIRQAEGEADINRMDVNEDGAVSPADVLFVVNTINDRVQADRERQIVLMQARAEGESNPVEGLDLSQLAATTAANLTQWDLKRRHR